MLTRHRSLIVSIAIVAASAAASADEPGGPTGQLKPFQASYNWIWHGMTVAESSLDLEHADTNWVYRSRSEPRGIGRMFSERPTQESIMQAAIGGSEREAS